MTYITFLDRQLYYCYSNKKFYDNESECYGKKYVLVPFIDSFILKREFINNLEYRYQKKFLELEKEFREEFVESKYDDEEVFLSAFDDFIREDINCEKRWNNYEEIRVKEIILSWRKENNIW